MELPSIIHGPKLVSGTGLIVRYEARTSTDQPSVVLVASPAEVGAISLEAAHQALIVLRRDGLPYPGSPAVLDYRSTREGGTMLTLAVRGAPLAFSWPDVASEVEVLRMALQHATLLAALHAAGFSGLQPGFEDLRWDAGHGLLTLLGWEWVRQNDDGRQRDLEVAASLWVELLTGAAPPLFPPLTAETSWQAWQRVSLGTRRLLASLLLEDDPSATADQMKERIDTILRNWQRPAAELLSVGLNTGEDLSAAMELFDLAARLEPDSVGSFRLGGVQERAAKRFDRLINDVRIGSYYPTVDKFQQLAGENGITGQERLRAWRWWAITNAAWRLPQVDAPDSTEQQQAFIDPFIEALSAADRHQVKTALNRLQKALADLEDEQKADSLQFLEGDLLGCLRIEEAVGNLTENPAISVELFEQAMSDIATLPPGYRAVLISQIGDPVVGLYQATQKRDHQELVHRTVNEAKAAFKANNLPLAEQKWNEALGLTGRQDSKRADYQKEVRRVRLRSKAISAGVAADLETVDDLNALVALQALAALRTAFPRDTWGVAQAKRWQKMLLSRLEKDPTGPAGAWLTEYWPKDATVRDSLERAAPKAIDAWQAKLVVLQNADPPATPQRVSERIQRLDTFLAFLGQSRQWLESTSSAEVYNTIFQAASDSLKELNALAAEQTRLAKQFQAVFDSGVPPLSVLAEAEAAGVEIFDDADLSVPNLRAMHHYQNVNKIHAAWRFAIGYADTAWRAGDVDLASRYYSFVLEDIEAPKRVHEFCQLAKEHMGKGYDSSSSFSGQGLEGWDDLLRAGNQQSAATAHETLDATTNPDLDASQPRAINDLSEVVQELRQWLIDTRLSSVHGGDDLLELARTRVLATARVRDLCANVLKLIQESHYDQATFAFQAAVSGKTRLTDLDKRCIDRHREYLESEREKRKEIIRTIVADKLISNDPLSGDEIAEVEKELEVYEELVNDQQAKILRGLWKNRLGARGRVAR